MNYFVWVSRTKEWVLTTRREFIRFEGVKFAAVCPINKLHSTFYIQKLYEKATWRQGKAICATCKYKRYDNSCELMGTHDPLGCDPVGCCDKGVLKDVH